MWSLFFLDASIFQLDVKICVNSKVEIRFSTSSKNFPFCNFSTSRQSSSFFLVFGKICPWIDISTTPDLAEDRSCTLAQKVLEKYRYSESQVFTFQILL